jgi:type II secretory pathway predicted ATPase ExeA
MYTKHFKLEGRPYTQGAQPHFYVPNDSVAATIARLAEVMTGHGAAAIVSGGPGVGKTALVAQAGEQAGDDAVIAWADIRQLEPESLLDQLLLGLGMDEGDGSGPVSANRLRVAVSEQNRAGRSVTAAIDVGTVTAERAKRLLRLAHLLGGNVGLNVVLMGPHTLHKVLDVPGMIHLRQRVCVRHRVRPLSEEETRNYITEGLSRVGGDPLHMLGDEVPSLVYRYVAGVPRLINTMMDSALTEAALRQLPRVNADSVGQVAQGLGWRTMAGKGNGNKAQPAQARAVPPAANKAASPFAQATGSAPTRKSDSATAAPAATAPTQGEMTKALVTPLEIPSVPPQSAEKPAAAKSEPLVDIGEAGVPEMDPDDTSATGMLRLEDLDERFAEHVFSEEK